MTPARREITDRFGNKLRVGRDRHPPQRRPEDSSEYKRYGPVEALGLGVRETYFIISRTLSYLATSSWAANPPTRWAGRS